MTTLVLRDFFTNGLDDGGNLMTVDIDFQPRYRTYDCDVAVYDEGDGRFSVFALDLPGVTSFGDTIEEAVENIRDALEATIAEYLESGAIPWQERKAWTPDQGRVAERRIAVHA